MPMHAISYDLSKPGRNYPDLYEAIKALGAWSHALESLWMVRTNLTTVEVRDKLMKVIDANDKLLVTELTGDWASLNIGKVHVEWLQSA